MLMKKSLPLYPIMVLALIGVGGYLGCDPDLIPSDLRAGAGSNGPSATSGNNSNYSEFIPERSAQRILIGSFNLQRLGPSKLSKPWVMERYADVIRRFDVIAIQEITSKDQTTLPRLLEEINKQGGSYSFRISPPIGRAATGGYYEQYAYIFDTQRLKNVANYVVLDERDMMHREPFVGRFQTVGGGGQPFGFTLINVHTDPDEIKYELDVLADVYRNVRQYEYPEDDVLLLGDLNQTPGKLQKLETIPAFTSLIVGMPTNTRKTKTLDNMLVDSQATSEFTGRAGTLDLESMFGINQEDALRISDHLPIWAEFSINEQSSAAAIAGARGPIVR